MGFKFYHGLLLCAFFIITSCKDENKKNVKTATVAFKKEAELSIYKQSTDSLITKFDIEIADSDYETQTGLMYRQSMGENQGMLFIFPDEALRSFYMKNTEFPLDLIFIDSKLKIASFQEDAQPLNEIGLTSKVAVQYVLELNAGLVKKWALSQGDSISFKKTGS